VREIARKTGIDTLIEELPNQYETQLGRVFGECDLSGGQWQRLTLAQVMAADPGIVILDEPASSLDLESERRLHHQIRTLLKGRTTLLISHRFSSVLMADRIVVLLEGRIAEQGTHAELVQKQGVYASMFQTHQNFFAGTDSPQADPTSTTEEPERSDRDSQAA